MGTASPGDSAAADAAAVAAMEEQLGVQLQAVSERGCGRRVLAARRLEIGCMGALCCPCCKLAASCRTASGGRGSGSGR
eukprot:366471-Chlamydomonas_euryale.AAC.6